MSVVEGEGTVTGGTTDPGLAERGAAVTMHVLDGLLRSGLEVSAWAGWLFGSIALLGWGWQGWLVGLIALVLSVVLWAVFAVPVDPSRNPSPPVAIDGRARLVLEMAILLGPVPLMLSVEATWPFVHLAGWFLHLVTSRRRTAWLVQQQRPPRTTAHCD